MFTIFTMFKEAGREGALEAGRARALEAGRVGARIGDEGSTETGI